MKNLAISSSRLIDHIRQLGEIGRDADGRLTRLAASDTDKAARDQFVVWLEQAGLEVAVDRIGNIFGIWRTGTEPNPLLIGSHIDTVIDAGIYDGCYGVLAGLEVIATLQEAGFAPARPIAVAAFTNEEGVRYTPDMMGSLVYAGGLEVEEALARTGADGATLGAELQRIGYAGTQDVPLAPPHAYVELHIEQGPILEHEAVSIGAVAALQGISWRRVTLEGVANHAGTTPMAMRRDAGYAAAKITAFVHERAKAANNGSVATVGRIAFEPNAINVIPARATFTIDLRNPDESRLHDDEAALQDFLKKTAAQNNLTFSVERLARFAPVTFDENIVAEIERAAAARGLNTRRMVSGAGHDAQMIARIAPAAMIFVPSKDGISHNPREHTDDAALVNGANVLLDVVAELAGAKQP